MKTPINRRAYSLTSSDNYGNNPRREREARIERIEIPLVESKDGPTGATSRWDDDRPTGGGGGVAGCDGQNGREKNL